MFIILLANVLFQYLMKETVSTLTNVMVISRLALKKKLAENLLMHYIAHYI